MVACVLSQIGGLSQSVLSGVGMGIAPINVLITILYSPYIHKTTDLLRSRILGDKEPGC